MSVVERKNNTIIRSVGYEFNKPISSSDLNESQTILLSNIIKYLEGVIAPGTVKMTIDKYSGDYKGINITGIRFCVVDNNSEVYYGYINPSLNIEFPNAKSGNQYNLYAYWRSIEITPDTIFYTNGIRTNDQQSSIVETTATNNVKDSNLDEEVSNRKGLELTFVSVLSNESTTVEVPVLDNWSSGVLIATIKTSDNLSSISNTTPAFSHLADESIHHLVDSKLLDDSENPVQNKVVKAGIDDLSKRISNNGYGEIAGGKNLILNTVYGYISFDPQVIVDDGSTSYIFYAQAGKTYVFSSDVTPTALGIRVAKVSSISPESFEEVSDYQKLSDGASTFTTNETGYYMLYAYKTKTTGIKFQIEEGTTATEYEPPFPSNRFLAEENIRQSAEMQDTKMMELGIMRDIKMLGWSVPRECPIQNEIYENQFIQLVGRIDLGSLDWIYFDTSGHERFRTIKGLSFIKPAKSNDVPANIYASGYTLNSMEDVYSHENDKAISVDIVRNILIYDSDYTDASDFKKAMKGKYLYYELEDSIITTMDGNEIGETLDDVRKETTVNLLNPNFETAIQGGVTCTNNGDGTFTINGTSSVKPASIFRLQTNIIENLQGLLPLKLIGNVPDSNVTLQYSNFSNRTFRDEGNGVIITEAFDSSTFPKACIDIEVKNGDTANNVVIKPMLTTNLSATYDDFVPYTGDAGSLNGDVADLQTDYGKGFIINKFAPDYSIIESFGNDGTGRNTFDGVTYIIEPDGSIKIEGTPKSLSDPDSNYTALQVGFFRASEVQGLKLIGCQGGSVDTYFVAASTSYYFGDDNIGGALKDTGNGVILNFTDPVANDYIYIYIVTKVGVTIPPNTYIKLMLVDNYEVSYKDYVPYINFGALIDGNAPDSSNPPPTIRGFSNDFVKYLLNVIYRMSRNLVVRSITVTNDPYDTRYSYDDVDEEYNVLGEIHWDNDGLVVPNLLINGSNTPATLSDIIFNIACAIEDKVTIGGITRECVDRKLPYIGGSLICKAIKLSGTATEDVVIPIFTISNPKVSTIYFRYNSSLRIFASTPTQTGENINYITLTKKEPVTFYIKISSGTRIRANTRNPFVYASYCRNDGHSDVSMYHISDDASSLVEILDHLKNNPVINKNMTVGTRLEDSVIGDKSFTSGELAQARGYCSTAMGDHVVSDGDLSQTLGCFLLANANQCAIGHFNSDSEASDRYGTKGTAFYIGNGTEYTRSNAFRVAYDGTPYSKAGLNTTGADYAEFFEWEDENVNNEDRRGYFVTLAGKKIKIAKEGDYILGIVSGFPAIIGNGDEEWKGRYVFDDFGCPVVEEFEYEEEVPEVITNEEGEEEVIIKKVKRTGTKWKEVPDYDPERPYVQRSERQEWSAVGMLGVLSVIDDGTCEVNGFCKVTDEGTATSSTTGYRVINRVNDHIVEVVFK